MAQPSTQDIVEAFDPSGYSAITGAGLGQLINGSIPGPDVGLVITTTDIAGVAQVPDAITNVKWQKYIWRRIQASAIVGYIWNPNAASDVTYLKWQNLTTAAIADGSVTNSKIAAGAVTDDKVSAVAYGKLTGAPAALPPNGAAGGDLTGNYPNPVINNNAVNGVKLLSDAAVDANRAVGADHVKNNVIDWARHWKLPTAIQGVIQSNEAGTAWSMQQLAILQIKAKVCGAVTSNVIIPYDNTTPQIGEGVEALNFSFTPKSASSILRIKFATSFSVDAVVLGIMALFVGAGPDCVAAVAVNPSGTAAGLNSIISIDHMIASPGVGAVTISVRFGPSAGGNMYINGGAIGVAKFNAFWKTYLIVEEFMGTLL